ncbi:MAG TPA: YeeE/YedE family protein [Dongiaceae bacterium]|nr:YeeE/YedE family protein [Dongiaceae bacterium]
MLRLFATLVAGIVFGLGLALSQMTNPAKVLAFLDVAGHWDPSLALVMAGALIVAVPGFQLTLEWPMPLLADRFELPVKGAIDARLVGGAALFGIGWGLVGFCPGPAFASLAYGLSDSLVFVLAMAAGAGLYRATLSPKAKPGSPNAVPGGQIACR